MGMSLEQFRASRRKVSLAEYEKSEWRPIDLAPDVAAQVRCIHGYTWVYQAQAIAYYILEMPDGFHFLFVHPSREVAPTLADAEAWLREWISNESEG